LYILMSRHPPRSTFSPYTTLFRSLVREVRVGGNSVDLDAELLELFILLSEVFKFGRAHEREVGRVENEYRPLAGNGFVADFDKLAVVVGGCFERLDLRIDQGHCVSFLYV